VTRRALDAEAGAKIAREQPVEAGADATGHADVAGSAAGPGVPDARSPAGDRFRHDGLFWRRLAHWGSTRAPRWWRRVGPAIVGALVFGLLRENRRSALANVRRVRGGAGAVRDAARTLALFVEFAYCVSEAFELAAPDGDPFEIEAPDAPEPELPRDRGLIVLTSHFGSWEVGARVMQRFARPVNVVMARESNATAEAFQQRVRELSGLRVIHSDSSLFSSFNMIHALRRGEVIAMQLDRSAPGQVTREVEFFGRPAPFQLGPFALARMAGVPLWPVFVARTGRRRYRVLLEPMRTIDRHASESEMLAVMAEVVRSFEQRVREYPGQWFQFRRFWPQSANRP